MRPVYSEVMEDYDVLSAALRLREEDTAVVISSAGDNVLNAALEGARHVFGVDIAPVQTALCRLKEAAIRTLSHGDFARLVGVGDAPPEDRLAALERLPARLVSGLGDDPGLREDVARRGLVDCGALAAFVAPLREGLVALVGAESMARILTSGVAAERARLFAERFDTAEVRALLADALNEGTISDSFIPAFAWGRMAEPEFHRFYHGVLRRRMVEGDPRQDHFLHRLWAGRFPSPTAVPPYLREERYPRLRERLDRITWHTADVRDFLATLPESSVDVLNLSNVPDWCDEEQHRTLWLEIERVATPGARVFLRSFLRARELPAGVRGRWRNDPGASAAMARADRVGYYARCELWTRSTDAR